jgi:O-antigen ligase
VTSFVAFESKSATSCLAIFGFCLLSIEINFLKRGGNARILAVMVMIFLPVIAVVGAFNMNSLLEALGKDPTLTGRTDIWEYVVFDIYQRPWLGWGYGAFWSVSNPAALRISDLLKWAVPEAHNGILEILLTVGVIGAAMFIYMWGRTLRLSLQGLRTSESAIAITCFLICTGVALQSVSEWALLYPGAFTGVFFVTSFFCEQAIRTRQQRLAVAPRRLVKVHKRNVEQLMPHPARNRINVIWADGLREQEKPCL